MSVIGGENNLKGGERYGNGRDKKDIKLRARIVRNPIFKNLDIIR
jgi:hypothetical protein